MSDPMQQKPPDNSPLFSQRQSTTQIAAGKAALNVGSWRQRIVDRLRIQPSTIFEIAEFYHVPDHTISGRFSELQRDGLIEPSGERRIKPASGCPAEVFRVRGACTDPAADLGELLGYPITLSIGGDLYDRQPLLPEEGYPGIPYARRADTGGARLVIRVQIVECPACGKPLRMLEEKGSKFFRCTNERCQKAWHTKAANEPGRPPLLSLVMFNF